jgi:NAD(P)H-dependent FMN reductase
MRLLIISSSLDVASRSERLAKMCSDYLADAGHDARFLSLKDHRLEGFDNGQLHDSKSYLELHQAVTEADGLVFASPIYNWGCCAELKKFVEYVGSTPPDGTKRGAFFDKVVTFVNSAGLPHSYMAFTSLANSMMLDFKCIVSPYNIYAHNQHWNGEILENEMKQRLIKSMDVFVELTALLQARRYKSNWEI